MEAQVPAEGINGYNIDDGSLDRSDDDSEDDDDDCAGIADEAHCNPEMPDDLAHAPEIDIMRGDAIGNTVYSQRFVINVLIKLSTNEIEMTEELENSLCTLWDMAIEKDVVHYLQSLGGFDVFTTAINNSNDRRLIEILVGTISNMCNIKEVSVDLASNLQGLINLVTCTDAPTLLQLMRLYWVIFGYLDIKWFDVITIDQIFVESVIYIWNNSTNKPLVECTMMAVNAVMASVSAHVERERKKQKQREKEEAEILAAQNLEAAATEAAAAPSTNAASNSQKTNPPNEDEVAVADEVEVSSAVDQQPTLMDLFINEEFIESTFMALDLLVNYENVNDDIAVVNVPAVSSNIEKIRRAFLTIHTFMIRNRRVNTHVNEELLQRLFIVLNQQLEPYCHLHNLISYAANAEEVLLSTGYTLQQILTLGFPYDIDCLAKLLSIYDMLVAEAKVRANEPINAWSDINAELAEKSTNMREIIIKTVSYAVDTLDIMQLTNLLAPQNDSTLMLLCNYYDSSEKEHYHARSLKIQNALNINDMGPGAGIFVGIEGEDDDVVANEASIVTENETTSKAVEQSLPVSAATEAAAERESSAAEAEVETRA